MEDPIAYDNSNGTTNDPDFGKGDDEPLCSPFTEDNNDSNSLNQEVHVEETGKINNINISSEDEEENTGKIHNINISEDEEEEPGKIHNINISEDEEENTGKIQNINKSEDEEEDTGKIHNVNISEDEEENTGNFQNINQSEDEEEESEPIIPIADINEVHVETRSMYEEKETEETVPENMVEGEEETIVNDVQSPVELQSTNEHPVALESICVDENSQTEKSDNNNSEKIQKLEDKILELEESCKKKDDTITSLQSEIEKLNIEMKSRSVPSTKKPTGPGADPKSKTVGAKRTVTRPASGAKAVPNGDAKKVPATSPKRPVSCSSRPRSAAPPKAAAAKPAAAKPAAAKPASGKKTGKAPNRVEMAKGHEGGRKNLTKIMDKDEKEHAVKLTLRGRGIICYPPTDFQVEDICSEKPEESLQIRWVYGYRGRDSQDNIFCLPSNELLYFQAAVGVIYNPATKTQRFYQGHNDDIKCIALNPANPSIVATGQAAGHDEKEGDPHVRVWNCETLETLAVLGLGMLQRAVGSVSFSPDGNKIVAVDEGNDHTIYVYDWKKKSQITSQKGHQDPVLGAEFVPSSNKKFVTYGKGHVIFWDLEGNKLVKKSGIFEKHPKPRFVTALAFNSKGEAITGDSNGNLFIWNINERKISKGKTGAHEGSVYSIAVKGEEVYTGGQDCKIKKFNADDLSDVDSWQFDEEVHGRVRAIAFVGDNLAVGTYNNGMLFGKFGDEPEQIIFGHGAGDLWGGSVHPSDNSFATVGQDKVVYIWDAEAHVPKHIFKVEKPAQSCAFSPDGSVLAVASTTGEWWVMDSTTGEVLSSYKSGPEQIDAISYSPDGKIIAVGSHDNITYLYSSENLSSEYKQIGRCSGHSSFITHLDFSEDGKMLQTTSGDYEHLFWETETGEQITNTKDLRDVVMTTYTCTLGFPVCGIWPVGYDGTDINSLSRSHDKKLVATADDFGLVNLFRYPCCDPTAAWSSFRGHSAHVTKVRFLNGDKEIFSLGGRDQSIIQWAIC